jgi:hypothetical protein
LVIRFIRTLTERNYSTQKVFSIFPSRCFVAASNSGRSPSRFPNCPRPQLPASKFSRLQLSTDSPKSQLIYGWRFTGNQFVLASSTLRLTTRDIFLLSYSFGCYPRYIPPCLGPRRKHCLQQFFIVAPIVSMGTSLFLNAILSNGCVDLLIKNPLGISGYLF